MNTTTSYCLNSLLKYVLPRALCKKNIFYIGVLGGGGAVQGRGGGGVQSIPFGLKYTLSRGIGIDLIKLEYYNIKYSQTLLFTFHFSSTSPFYYLCMYLKLLGETQTV